MEWSPQQARALEAVEAWVNGPQDNKVFRLFGYAGTGKSTLAKYVGEHEGKRGGFAQFAAFTGKAAVVMRKKGCLNARTLHSLIYTSHDKSTAELTRLENELERASPVQKPALMRAIEDERTNLSQPGFSLKSDPLTIWEEDEEHGVRVPRHKISMFVIDECSMVDDRLGGDLLSTKARVLVLGDPAQLPPVAAGAGFFTNGKPDVLLSEIHRQALDSPIIEMANQVRQGNMLNVGQYGNGCGVVQKSDMSPDEAKNLFMCADQILCGKNITRHGINGRVRDLKGFTGYLPEPGEKLVCLRNSRDDGLLNGSLWECINAEDIPTGPKFRLHARSLDEVDAEVECLVHKAHFMGQEITDFYEKKEANEFDFGYALTVHKSQGSQWDNVVLVDEWSNRDSRKQWLYTGITRAAERITVVRS